MDLLEKLKQVRRILRGHYNPENHFNKAKVFDEILFIFFSWRTPIRKAEEIFQDICSSYPNKNDLFELPEDTWFQFLHSGGKARDKARTIVKLLMQLKQDFNSIEEIENLANWHDENIKSYLISLPGIKEKSAYCIMLYAMKKAFFPADAHCLRICQRLGIIKGTNQSKKDRERGQKELNEILEGDFKICYDLHTMMILHGKQICRRTPLCDQCIIADYCEYKREQRF
jgi:endonuclease-3 related protein